MDLREKKVLVIGGDGLIGSHAVDELVKEEVAEPRTYNNFVRSRQESFTDTLRGLSVKKFNAGTPN